MQSFPSPGGITANFMQMGGASEMMNNGDEYNNEKAITAHEEEPKIQPKIQPELNTNQRDKKSNMLAGIIIGIGCLAGSLVMYRRNL